MDESFGNVIKQAASILILLPTKPYFDQVAAGLSLHLALKGKKESLISCPSSMTVEFNRLIGVNKITQELGDKNLIIRFSDYDPKGVERVSADVKEKQFTLTVIPKPQVAPPKKDQIEISHAGVAADTIILIGGASESHFPAVSSKDLVGAKFVHVGRKDLRLASDKNFISFASPASSCSELVATLIKESGLGIDEDIATNILAGIEDSTDNLRDQSTTADTFQVVADMMRVGGRRLARVPKQNFPPGAVPGQKMSTNQDSEINSNEAPKDWLKPKIYKGTSTS